MKLYYTSSVGQDQIQTDPRLSLGGYRSASVVPSNSFDNLFGEISQFLLSKEVPEDEYIGVILKNESEYDIENLKLWFDYPTDSYSLIKISAVDLTEDTSGILKMEHIPNKNTKPLYAEFYEADGEENAVDLGSFEVGDIIGLWFCRQLIEDLAITIQTDANLYEVDPEHTNMVKPITPEKSDSISINFSWDLVYGDAIGDELIPDYFITQDLASVFSGDTYLGCEFQLMEDDDPDVPIILTDAIIELTTNNSSCGLTTEDGSIEITDDLNGIFNIPEQIINWPAATYHYKIKVIFVTGRVRTYVVGIWKILK